MKDFNIGEKKSEMMIRYSYIRFLAWRQRHWICFFCGVECGKESVFFGGGTKSSCQRDRKCASASLLTTDKVFAVHHSFATAMYSRSLRAFC